MSWPDSYRPYRDRVEHGAGAPRRTGTHAPPPQETDDPAPTVCVQDWTLQTIWQLSPLADVEILLPDPASVAGVVRGSAPEIRNLRVEARSLSGMGDRKEQFSGTDGRWHLDGLALYRLIASTADSMGSTQISLKEEEAKQGVVILLESGGAITGRVVRAEDGEPVQAALGADDREVTGGADGLFRIDSARVRSR